MASIYAGVIWSWRRRGKINWDTLQWLETVYAGNVSVPGDMPNFDEINFYKVPADVLERSKQVLLVLELVEFRWTILDVLAQPEPELNAIIQLKTLGERIRSRSRNTQEDE